MTTSIKTLRAADWDRLERDVVARIRVLRAMAEHMRPDEINDKIANDLVLPNLKLLGEFCACVGVAGEKDCGR